MGSPVGDMVLDILRISLGISTRLKRCGEHPHQFRTIFRSHSTAGVVKMCPFKGWTGDLQLGGDEMVRNFSSPEQWKKGPG